MAEYTPSTEEVRTDYIMAYTERQYEQYTPTTDEVREDFAYPWEGFKQNREGRLAAFDRWYQAELRRAKAEAEELFPTDDTTYISIHMDDLNGDLQRAFIKGRTASAEQVEAAAAMFWAVCSVRDCRAWVQLTDAMQETFRDDTRAAFRAAKFYVMEDDE